MMKRKFFTILCLWLLSMSGDLRAQGTGAISGKITDQKTGEPLIGVTILLTGTSLGAVSDVQGSYLLSNAPAGIYTVTIKLLGYQPKSITGVAVKSGNTASLSVMMGESVSQKLDEVVVTSSYKQESINALYSERKKNSVISDGISADLIRKSADKNTGEVLKRISGTSIQDNKFVVIRGLAERYNATMMNDAVMPATEPDKKAFSFNIVPSNLIDHIVIYKTASPDLPGDAAGGTIRINTKDFPDQKFMAFSVGTGYNTQTTLKDFYADPTHGQYDFVGFDDGSRSLPDAFVKVQKNYATLPTAEKMAITKEFANTYGGTKDGSSLPPLSLQLSLGNTKVYKNNNKLGFTAAVNYSNSRNVLYSQRAEYLLSKEQLYAYNDEQYAKHYNTGALLNIAYTFGKNKLSLKNFYSNEFSSSFMKRTGQVFDGSSNTTNVFSMNNETTQNGLFNTVLEGVHELGESKLSVTWNLAYGLSYRLQPDQRILSMYQNQDAGSYALHLSNENSPAIKDAGRVYSRLHENIYSANLHFSLPFSFFNQEQKFKFGFTKVYRSRTFHVLALGYASEFDPFGRGATIALEKGMTPADIFSLENLDHYKIVLANIPQNTKDYTGTTDLNAGYLMFDNHLSPQWHLTWGARIENYAQRLNSINQPIQKDHYTDILPSANLTWSITDKASVRAAYSRTLNRPEFRELAAFRYYDYENDFIISGNPDLQRSINDNADLRFEYYPSASEIFSASVFYKNFRHPIEQTNQGNNVLSYDNADNALDYGIELEVRKSLAFIGAPQIFDHLIFNANASFIKGNVTFNGQSKARPMQGQSPYMINGGLSYAPDNNDFSVAVLYNRIGQRLKFRGENDGLDTYEKPRDLLDFQLSKKVLHRAGELRLTISDILAQPMKLYYKYETGSKTQYRAAHDKIISSIQPGTNFSLTFKYNFSHAH